MYFLFLLGGVGGHLVVLYYLSCKARFGGGGGGLIGGALHVRILHNPFPFASFTSETPKRRSKSVLGRRQKIYIALPNDLVASFCLFSLLHCCMCSLLFASVSLQLQHRGATRATSFHARSHRPRLPGCTCAPAMCFKDRNLIFKP